MLLHSMTVVNSYKPDFSAKKNTKKITKYFMEAKSTAYGRR